MYYRNYRSFLVKIYSYFATIDYFDYPSDDTFGISFVSY